MKTTELRITNVGGLVLEAMDIWVSYDPAVVEFSGGRLGAGLQGAFISTVPPNDLGDSVKVSGITITGPIGVTPAEGSVLYELDFHILDQAVAGTTVQELTEVKLNEQVFTSLGATPNATGGIINVVGLADGDINDDGSVNAADVLLASRFALGLADPDTPQLVRGNVAPLVGGIPSPTDNVIGVDDLLLIQKKALTGAFQ